MRSSGNYLSVKVSCSLRSIIQDYKGAVALSQEFVEDRNDAKKNTGGSNFLMPIDDRASKEVRDHAIDPRVPGMPVEKLGGNSASRNRNGERRAS